MLTTPRWLEVNPFKVVLTRYGGYCEIKNICDKTPKSTGSVQAEISDNLLKNINSHYVLISRWWFDSTYELLISK